MMKQWNYQLIYMITNFQAAIYVWFEFEQNLFTISKNLFLNLLFFLTVFVWNTIVPAWIPRFIILCRKGKFLLFT